MEWVWWFLFGLCLIYALAITNKIVSQYKFFPSDSLIKKKKKNQHIYKLNTITKTQNQNIIENTKKNFKIYIR